MNRPGTSWLPFGLLCTAPRGGGWAGERSNPIMRRERGAMVGVMLTEWNVTKCRVQFPDGTSDWYPLNVVSFADCVQNPAAEVWQ